MPYKKEYFDFLDDTIIDGTKLKNIYQKFIVSYKELSVNDDVILDLTINDNDTPQTIAYQYYDDKKYYWILLVINDIIDYFYDWLLTYEELRTLTDKYWEDGETYDFTNKDDLFAYLETENEKKRQIKYLNPMYLNDFLSTVKDL